MKIEYFIDGFQQIHFAGGMVRIDTFRLSPQEDGEPKEEVAERIIMTPQGFVSALNAMQQLADKLIDVGIMGKNED